MRAQIDLVLVNPGERTKIYQSLGSTLTAIEPPLWCRLIGGYARDRGNSIVIIDAEAEHLTADQVAERIAELSPRLVAMVVFGHQPSASTQQMVGAGMTCRAIKARKPDQPIIIVGGHVAALPERTLREEAVDFACNSEGPVTVAQLLDALREEEPSLDSVEGLVYRQADTDAIRSNLAPALIKDLDGDLHGDVWDLLPMGQYRAHNWQCFGDLGSRQPYASIYTSLGCPYKCSFCCINAPFG
ncbi:radical SAM protein [Azospirillum sp. INR13]|uniref:B12-binding domain-containing radical SAM protein n=1 Tax=Azospirillum sp. INR13 TaxID=2596919 RepID=UPI002107C2E4|nr:cobalamin-dependent protein [Azospirillum sp. INR13]